jgi:hypothetical protein
MKASLVVMLFLAATALHAQSDPEHPAALHSNVLEATTHGSGGDSYYHFTAGPGDVTIAVQARTDYYSSPVEIELLSADGKSIGSINVVATDSTGRASRTLHLAERAGITLKIGTQADSHVKWLKYRVGLKGAVELQAKPAAPPAEPAAPVAVLETAPPDPTAATTNDVPPAPPAEEASAPGPSAQADPALDALAQLLESIQAIPASGSLRIDMKDGTHRMIDLSQVLRLSVVRSK